MLDANNFGDYVLVSCSVCVCVCVCVMCGCRGSVYPILQVSTCLQSLSTKFSMATQKLKIHILHLKTILQVIEINIVSENIYNNHTVHNNVISVLIYFVTKNHGIVIYQFWYDMYENLTLHSDVHALCAKYSSWLWIRKTKHGYRGMFACSLSKIDAHLGAT